VLVLGLALGAPAAAGVEPFPKGIDARQIATNGTTLYVRVGGQGPAVLLLHGFGDTGDMWAPLAALLVKDHTVIVPICAAWAFRRIPTRATPKRIRPSIIAGVLDALKIEKADLVTHDIGNMVGLRCRGTVSGTHYPLVG